MAICDSDEDAVELAQAQQRRVHGEDPGDEYVRLLLLHSNAELCKAVGKNETCNTKSAMYMIVHPTCPLYWTYAFPEDQRNEMGVSRLSAFAHHVKPLSTFLGEVPAGTMPAYPLWSSITSAVGADNDGEMLSCALKHPVMALRPQQVQESQSSLDDSQSENSVLERWLTRPYKGPKASQDDQILAPDSQQQPIPVTGSPSHEHETLAIRESQEPARSTTPGRASLRPRETTPSASSRQPSDRGRKPLRVEGSSGVSRSSASPASPLAKRKRTPNRSARSSAKQPRTRRASSKGVAAAGRGRQLQSDSESGSDEDCDLSAPPNPQPQEGEQGGTGEEEEDEDEDEEEEEDEDEDEEEEEDEDEDEDEDEEEEEDEDEDEDEEEKEEAEDEEGTQSNEGAQHLRGTMESFDWVQFSEDE